MSILDMRDKTEDNKDQRAYALSLSRFRAYVSKLPKVEIEDMDEYMAKYVDIRNICISKGLRLNKSKHEVLETLRAITLSINKEAKRGYRAYGGSRS